MIHAESLTRIFGKVTAVDRADFHVPAGKVTGFVGPNGAGKTTVLRLIIGLVTPTAGRVLVQGIDPRRDDLAVRRITSYLPAENPVYLHMTGARFLQFTAGFREARDGELLERLPRLFELPLRRRVRTYSSGMRQKLALAATLAAPVPLLLLDEPTRALDATMRAQFMDALELLRARGRTIFVSSHHLADIERVCDGIIFMVEGRVVPPERIQALQAELGGQIRVQLQPGAAPADLGLPAGATWEERNRLLRIRVPGDPRPVVARLASGPVRSLAWGRAELEEIYRLLYLGGGEGER